MLASIRVVIVALLCVAGTGLVTAQEQRGKIPVTTRSEEARQLYLLGLEQADRFRNVEARTLFEQAVAKDPDFALAYRDLAFVQPSTRLFLESMAKAVELSERASECEREWILASQAGSAGEYRAQREHLGRLVEKCGQDERAHAALGIYYFGRQQYDSSEAALERATTLASEFIPAWNMLGYARRSQGDFDGAEQAFRRYIELAPTDANAHDSYAELLLKQGRYDEAVNHYREALAVDPAFAISRFNMAAPLTYQGKPDEARRELNTLLSGARDMGEQLTAHFGLAMVAVDEGKHDEAVRILMQTDSLNAAANDLAGRAQNATTLGFLYLEQRRYDEAKAQFDQAVSLSQASNLPPAAKALAERTRLYAQARIAAEQGQTDEARRLADRFAEQAQAAGAVDDIRAMHELYGILALEAKDHQKAVTELKQANLENAYNLYRLALAYHGLGQHAEAERQMTAAANYNGLLNLNNVAVRRKAVELAREWSGD